MGNVLCVMVDFAFLDSGTGGIPYMLALKEKQKAARCVYLGDTAHFPYGEKTPEEVSAAASSVIRMMVERWQPRALVIACNTISVTALDSLRAQFPTLPIVGTVPAIRLAARVTKNKRIGLLATNATVNHPYCARLIADYASDCEVFSRGDPDLVAFIEQKFFTASDAEKYDAVRPAVSFFTERGCDTIILGCTHFTHIAREIAAVAGSGVSVIDSRDGVANQALKVAGAGGSVAGNAAGTVAAGSVAGSAAAGSVPGDAAAGTGGGSATEGAAVGAGPAACGATASAAVGAALAACGATAGETDGVAPTAAENPADMSFFVTACSSRQRTEYETLCQNLHIPFGGLV
ncbi:MAG: glutamate racemase [Treponema sp.]|nr:glutamate racemase [Treponema sp.]